MIDNKNQRRAENACSGALKRLGKGRESAMVKAMQNLEKETETGTIIDPLHSSARPSSSAGKYPTKGHKWVDAEVCQPWRLADRPECEAVHAQDLADSFQKDGQIAPAIVRPVRDSDQPNIRYEIIAGQVRWKAALQSGRQFLVDIRPELDDQTAFRIMVAENDTRQGLSEYAKALRYRRALQEGLYISRRELAEELDLSEANLSKYLSFAELPEAIVSAFQSMTNVSLRLGYELSRLCRAGETETLLTLVPRLKQGEITADTLAQGVEKAKATLTSAPSAPASTESVRRILSRSGAPLFSVRIGRNQQASLRFHRRLTRLLDDPIFVDRLRQLVEDAEIEGEDVE